MVNFLDCGPMADQQLLLQLPQPYWVLHHYRTDEISCYGQSTYTKEALFARFRQDHWGWKKRQWQAEIGKGYWKIHEDQPAVALHLVPRHFLHPGFDREAQSGKTRENHEAFEWNCSQLLNRLLWLWIYMWLCSCFLFRICMRNKLWA